MLILATEDEGGDNLVYVGGGDAGTLRLPPPATVKGGLMTIMDPSPVMVMVTVMLW